MHEINVNKRSRTIKLFVLYFVVACVLLFSTYILVLAARGYDIDRSSGRVIQNGILLIESSPSGASVYLNDRLEEDRAPGGYPVPQGRYSIRMEKDGYRPWENIKSVVGSGITWLRQPLLIPEVIDTDTVQQLDELSFIAQSPDFSVLLAATEDKPTQLQRFDIDSSSVQTRSIALPNRLFDANDKGDIIGSLDFEQWSSDGRYVLLSYSSQKSKNQHFVVDIENPAESWRTSGAYSQILFTADNRLFGLQENTLYEIFEDKSREELLDAVEGMSNDGSQMWLLRELSGNRFVASFIAPQQALIEVDEQTNSFLVTEFEGRPRITTLSNTKAKIYGELNLFNTNENIPQKVLNLKPETTTLGSYSSGGRFIMLHTTDSAQVFDLDTQKTYQFADLNSKDINMHWVSAYQLAYKGPSDQVYLIDFDGTNSQQITSFTSEYGAFLNTAREKLFTIDTRSVGSGLYLRESSLLSEKDR